MANGWPEKGMLRPRQRSLLGRDSRADSAGGPDGRSPHLPLPRRNLLRNLPKAVAELLPARALLSRWQAGVTTTHAANGQAGVAQTKPRISHFSSLCILCLAHNDPDVYFNLYFAVRNFLIPCSEHSLVSQVWEASAKRSALGIRQEELAFHLERYGTLITQCSFLCGFAFESIVHLDAPPGTSPALTSWFFASLGLCVMCSVYTVVCGSCLVVLGQQLALLGAGGESLEEAVVHMRTRRFQLFGAGFAALFFLLSAGAALAWIKMGPGARGRRPHSPSHQLCSCRLRDCARAALSVLLPICRAQALFVHTATAAVVACACTRLHTHTACAACAQLLSSSPRRSPSRLS